MDTKILITGATGLVGKALTQHCLAAGIAVNYLSTRAISDTQQPGLQGFLWNPITGTIDLNCFEGVQAIINLAGSPINAPWSSKGRALILQSRINSLSCLRNGLNACSNHNVSYLVSASAIGIYPSSETAWYTEENEHKDTGFLASVVRQWEAEARQFELLNIKTGILRIGLVLARRGGVLPVLAQPIRLGLGAPFGSGKQWQSWIHISDLVDLFCFALNNRLEGVYNAVAPNPVTQTKLIKAVARCLKRPVWLPSIPASVLKIALGSRAVLVLASQRVSAYKIQELGFSFRYANLVAALENLLEGKKQ